ncbi:succinoglycan biosynthesis protein exoa [Paractinoplanes deccanensis]|uniref:Succinoglycan biosynthesis protein exoa n=2 Tax=Paractinoplanes deccanensis TaxID=113561 RepID=A0ABQ3YKI1_9ACTN|nr:succinoglycan biosynthesis protein exoa [Actinoplanes deccanensis]
MPFVSVVVPCWNEADFIEGFLDAVQEFDYPADRLEVLVVDGMSDDGTRDVLQKRDAVRLIDNPGRSKPVALNLGIREAKGDIIVRLDVHADYPPDYLAKCVRGLLDHPDADNVGGVRRSEARDDNLIGRAIALSTTDAFGAGNTRYRIGAAEPQWVDTVFGGCYRREVFDRIGYFDEALTRAQDREFNQRLRAAGGKILLLPDITCTYYARSGYREFCGWMFEGGYWPFRASRAVGRWIGSWRNVVPLGFVLAASGGLALSPFSRAARRLTFTLLGTYGAAAAYSGARLARRHRDPRLLAAMPLIFATTHVVYGVGSVWGILDPAGRRRS